MEDGARKTMFDGVFGASISVLAADDEPLDDLIFRQAPPKQSRQNVTRKTG